MPHEFGYFDDNTNEYVITTPLTPRPWENRIWNDDLNLQVTNHGEGIVYERDHEGRFILYLWNGHRALYVYDHTTGTLWSPAWYPVNAELDRYECRHGLQYTTIVGEKDGMEVTWRTTVHPTDATELWQVTVRNTSDRPHDILLLPYYQMNLSFNDAYFGPCNLFRVDVDLPGRCLYVKNHSFHCDLDRYALAYHSDRPITKYELNSAAFFKRYSSLNAPQTVLADSFTNAPPDEATPAFAVGYNMSIPAGRYEQLNAQIYSAASFEQAKTRAAEYDAPHLFDNAIAAHRAACESLLAENTIQTADADFDRYVNVWIKQQLRYNAMWNRGWNMGFRDAMQDCDAYRRHDAELVRKRILEATRHIYADGHTVRKWAKIDTKLYFDGGVWYVNTIVNYIRETGDAELLCEESPYLNQEYGSVLDHMKRAMDFLYAQRGPGGICRMGFGDWNDALNGIDREGKGESVWTTMAYIWALRNFVDLLEHLHNNDADTYRAIADELTGTLNERYFEGDRYIRAVTDAGVKVGSRENTEGSLYLNPQSWAITSGVANESRAAAVIQSVRDRLETDFGPVLLTPPYTSYREDVGRISADPPGTVENGANYVHASMFYAYALATAGRADECLDLLQRVLPNNPKNPLTRSRMEPFSITNAYGGPNTPHAGRSKFAWRTGAAGWWLKVVWDKLLGIVPDFDAVRVDAHLPAAWGDLVTARRKIRGRLVEFVFTRNDATPTGKFDTTVCNGDSLAYDKLHDGLRVRVTL